MGCNDFAGEFETQKILEICAGIVLKCFKILFVFLGRSLRG